VDEPLAVVKVVRVLVMVVVPVDGPVGELEVDELEPEVWVVPVVVDEPVLVVVEVALEVPVLVVVDVVVVVGSLVVVVVVVVEGSLVVVVVVVVLGGLVVVVVVVVLVSVLVAVVVVVVSVLVAVVVVVVVVLVAVVVVVVLVREPPEPWGAIWRDGVSPLKTTYWLRKKTSPKICRLPPLFPWIPPKQVVPC
jgi:hypothetical protein